MELTNAEILALIDARAATDAGFADYVANRRDGDIAEALSAGRTRLDAATKYSSLGIAERHPAVGPLPSALAAESTLLKLEGFAAGAVQSSDPATMLLGHAVQRQMKHLEGEGMVIGSPALAEVLSALVTAGVLTQDEAGNLMSVAKVDDPIPSTLISDALNARARGEA